VKEAEDGPSLATYVETRFNLLTEQVKDAQAQSDKRYEQRWEASRAAVDAAFSAQKEAINAALAAADRAVAKAEAAAEKRFEGVNEFRQTLADQQRTLIPRGEVIVMVRAIEEKLVVIQTQLERLNAERIGIKGGWGYAVGVAGLMLTLFSLLMVFWKFRG